MDDLALRSPYRAELSMTTSMLVLSLATVLALIPFLDKPFHIDDPLFAWAAQQIQLHPTDFFGFKVNWYGSITPMHTVTQNPPLACYYLAAAASLFGWNERWLHAAFLLPAVGTVLGTWVLARKLCRQPILTGLAVVCSPVFLVSSTNVMCDVLMTCFWMWSIILWRDGLDKHSWWRMAAGAVLAGLAALTKYYGICLIPLLALLLIARQSKGWLFLGYGLIPAVLLAAYQVWSIKTQGQGHHPLTLLKYYGFFFAPLIILFSVVRRQTIWLHLFWLAIPIAFMIGYELWTDSLYGHGLVTGATQYAREHYVARWQRGSLVKVVATLAFTGGCLISLPFLIPRLLRNRQTLLILMLALGMTIGLACVMHHFSPLYLKPKGIRPTTWDIAVQASLLTILGLAVACLGIVDVLTTGWRCYVQERLARLPKVFLSDKELQPAAISSREPGESSRVLMADSLLLASWLFGTMLFAGYVNWSVNGRSVLPLVPAAAILMCRRMDGEGAPWPSASFWKRLPGGQYLSRAWQHLYAEPRSTWQWLPLLPALILTLLVTHSDYTLAWAQRNAAERMASVQRETGARMWFIGHWGFQYYMEKNGAVALGHGGPTMLPGDLIALPDNNSLQTIPSPDGCEIVNIFKFETSPWAYTQSNVRRAGFYADRWGPLPFVFGEERYVGRREATMEFDAHIDTYHLFKVTHELKTDGLISAD